MASSVAIPRHNIALVGNIAAGKDTVADILVREYGYQRIAFADHLKDMAAYALDAATRFAGSSLHHEVINRARIERDKEYFRTFLQWLGGDFMREYLGKDTYWIDHVLHQTRFGRKYVLTDLRYYNEAQAMAEHGWQIVRVQASDNTRFDRYLGRTTMPAHEVSAAWTAANEHSSERDVERIAQDFAPLIIDNDGEYDDLLMQMEAFMEKFNRV